MTPTATGTTTATATNTGTETTADLLNDPTRAGFIQTEAEKRDLDPADFRQHLEANAGTLSDDKPFGDWVGEQADEYAQKEQSGDAGAMMGNTLN